ncbi:DUF4145 domain-containing protein [Haemophilus haemolyticus]|uniref:DUF4145 domain-containing protein n=2 Tax=Haemophilus haemolyticus TaxID=726 RepID=A0A502LR66_HAEHA|nr:DUF4145 domain-containing protein [Haemophilus haemolyticus]
MVGCGDEVGVINLGGVMEEKYTKASLQIINDIFYVKGLSIRGRITLIRQYTEILCRILLEEKGHLRLANFEKKLNMVLPNAHFKDELFQHVKNITNLGNSATHLEVDLAEVDEQDQKSAINSLNFIISYLFINYFSKYRFGINEHSMSIFSLLPPFIRVNVLTHLYEKDKENVAIMYKLPLAILKSEGMTMAIKWIEDNKELLSKTPWGPYNMYEFNLNKIQYLNESQPNGFTPLYSSFEEALGYYNSKIERYRDDDKQDIRELIKLTDFIYVGRMPEKYDLSRLDDYLLHRFTILP